MIIDQFSDLKNCNIGEETKIYVYSWKERSKMDNLHNRLTSDLGKKNEIFCYS